MQKTLLNNNYLNINNYMKKENYLHFVLYPKLLVIKKDFNTKHYIQEIYALTKRLIIQGLKRPSFIITGILQPLLWLIFFGALFQNAPIEIFTFTTKYKYFISAGIIVFTAFTSSLNAGLTLIFDREFGFLNRLLSSPIESRYSVIISSTFNIIFINFFQIFTIMYICYCMGYHIVNYQNLFLIIIILTLLSNSITNISLSLAFILPGHVELLACILIINLPSLFSSTALAPLVFMPSWLQIIASINPLSYAIETVRYSYINSSLNLNSIIMETVWGRANLLQILLILFFFNIISFIYVKKIISNKFEE
jgi:ABC-2 type transport system permease protein